MHGSPLPGWLLVVLCASAGGYCLYARARASAAQRRAAGHDAVMGLGMALMALPVGGHGGHGGWAAGVCAVVFGAEAVRTLLRAAAHPHHAVGALAMAYMALPTAPGEHSRAGLPAVTGALLAYFAGYALRTGVRLVLSGGDGARRWQPVLAAGCRLCLAIGMMAMLVTP
ncbi:DUF5134 domain-containing protein [Streptomyces sp. NPDC051940]|uniref:DUF5134 domain-containing protein n=1 Tax=Streptomyces sp. NPDC051940 TaxID=3155675 RepID=UPI00343878AC